MDKDIIQQAFKGNLIEELGLETLPEAQKINLLAAVTDLIGMRVMVRVAEKLPDADEDAFLAMLEKSPGEEVFNWLRAKGIPFEEYIVEEIAKVKEELAKRAAAVK